MIFVDSVDMYVCGVRCIHRCGMHKPRSVSEVKETDDARRNVCPIFKVRGVVGVGF